MQPAGLCWEPQQIHRRASHHTGEETSMDFSLLALVEPNYTWSNKSLAMQFPLQTRSAGLPFSRSTFPSLYLLAFPSPRSSPLVFLLCPVYIYCKFTFHSGASSSSVSLSLSLYQSHLMLPPFSITQLSLWPSSLSSSSSSHHRATSLPPSSPPCPCVSVSHIPPSPLLHPPISLCLISLYTYCALLPL